MLEKWTHEEYTARQREGFPGLQSVQIMESRDGCYMVHAVSIEEWNKSKATYGTGPDDLGRWL